MDTKGFAPLRNIAQNLVWLLTSSEPFELDDSKPQSIEHLADDEDRGGLRVPAPIQTSHDIGSTVGRNIRYRVRHRIVEATGLDFFTRDNMVAERSRKAETRVAESRGIISNAQEYQRFLAVEWQKHS